MAKLYFVETNGGFLTVAAENIPEYAHEGDRACYMWQDGCENCYPCNNPRWDDAGAAEREEIATAYLNQIADYNNFESLYSDCNCSGGFCGVYTVADFWNDIALGNDIIAEIDFV